MAVDTDTTPRVIICGAGPVGTMSGAYCADSRPFRRVETFEGECSLSGSGAGTSALTAELTLGTIYS